MVREYGSKERDAEPKPPKLEEENNTSFSLSTVRHNRQNPHFQMCHQYLVKFMLTKASDN